jgi:hypothetical protein
MNAIRNHRLRVNILARVQISDLLRLLNDPVLLGPVPKRGELGGRRLMRSLKLRRVVLSHFSFKGEAFASLERSLFGTVL